MRARSACGSTRERVRVQREAVDRRRAEADDGVGEVGRGAAAARPRGVCGSRSTNQRTRERTISSTLAACARRASRALSTPLLPAPIDGDALAREIVVAAALEHDAHARIVACARAPGGTRGNGVTPSASTASRACTSSPAERRHAHAAVGQRDPVRRRSGRSRARTGAGTTRRSARKCCSGSGSRRSASPLRTQASSVPAPLGAERLVCSQSERSSMSGGISRCHVRMGSPKVRALPLTDACAATERPNGPAPTIAVSMRSTSLNVEALASRLLLLASAGARTRPRLRRRASFRPARPTRSPMSRACASATRMHVPDHTGVTAVWPHARRSLARLVLLRHRGAERRRRADGHARDRGVGLPGDARPADGHVRTSVPCTPA